MMVMPPAQPVEGNGSVLQADGGQSSHSSQENRTDRPRGAAALKAALRRLAYLSGALPGLHRRRNRDHLTTVMFHRVLSPRDPRWAGADPEYTLSDALFEQALAFLARHYSIVSLDDLLRSLDGNALPPRPLLVTFDDGWADNAEYALEPLRRIGAPAVIFVAAEVIGRHDAFWQERLYAAWRTGDLTVESLHGRAAGLGLVPAPAKPVANSEAALRDCIEALARVPAARRDDLVEQCAASQGGPAQMASVEQIRRLAANGVAVGAHGYSHTPLPDVDARSELIQARERLEASLGDAHASVASLSFPHGCYDAATVDAAMGCGYRLLFTSDPVLTLLSRGRRLDGRLLGRIDIPARAVIDSSGEFSPERMATWLFTRSAQRLALDRR